MIEVDNTGSNDNARYCPFCNRQITQHVITSKWRYVEICSCGWTSVETPATRPYQLKFYKVTGKADEGQTIDLVAIFPSEDKHQGRKMFKDHKNCFSSIPHSNNI